MIYAVIDTNIFVSAFLTNHSDSPTIKTLHALSSGKIVALYNDEILAEYNEVLRRKKFKIPEPSIVALINYIQKHGLDTARTPFLEDMPDEDDRVFYEVSLSHDDSFLVTGNLKHYPIKPHVVTPAEFIAIIES